MDRRSRHSGAGRAFDRVASAVAERAGHPGAFVGAVAVLALWGVSGPLLGFSDTWQLIINTSTTIVTFLMVFLIQHSSNKSARALQMKLDELIAATDRASNRLINVEDLDDDELEEMHRRMEELSKRPGSERNGSGVSARHVRHA